MPIIRGQHIVDAQRIWWIQVHKKRDDFPDETGGSEIKWDLPRSVAELKRQNPHFLTSYQVLLEQSWFNAFQSVAIGSTEASSTPGYELDRTIGP